MRGTIPTSIHRPLRPVSWRRRTSTASVGTIVPRAQTIQISERITPCGPVMVVEPSASIRTPSGQCRQRVQHGAHDGPGQDPPPVLAATRPSAEGRVLREEPPDGSAKRRAVVGLVEGVVRSRSWRASGRDQGCHGPRRRPCTVSAPGSRPRTLASGPARDSPRVAGRHPGGMTPRRQAPTHLAPRRLAGHRPATPARVAGPPAATRTPRPPEEGTGASDARLSAGASRGYACSARSACPRSSRSRAGAAG